MCPCRAPGSHVTAEEGEQTMPATKSLLNGTQSSRSHMRPFVAALLLLAGGAWLVLALQAGSMGLMPVTMGVAMPSFVAMWTLMVAAMMVPSITPLASRYLRTIESPRSFGLL